MKVNIKGFRCLRCLHEWKPRGQGLPAVCPKCKSAYWNRRKKYVNSKEVKSI